MSMIDERLEILIGRFIDGEISPAERRALEDELSRNCQARVLLEQLEALRDGSRAVVASQTLGQGGECQEVFERAWRRHKRTAWGRVMAFRAGGHLRFAVGLAAGFLLGLTLHFVLVWTGAGPAEPGGRPPVVRDVAPEPETTLAATRDSLRPVIRNVDWYGFTDNAGNQWLVEGVREGMIRPAAYHGDVR